MHDDTPPTLTEMIEEALRQDNPDEGTWPTGDQIDLIVAQVRCYDDLYGE